MIFLYINDSIFNLRQNKKSKNQSSYCDFSFSNSGIIHALTIISYCRTKNHLKFYSK
jgi:hypothetical protein